MIQSSEFCLIPVSQCLFCRVIKRCPCNRNETSLSNPHTDIPCNFLSNLLSSKFGLFRCYNVFMRSRYQHAGVTSLVHRRQKVIIAFFTVVQTSYEKFSLLSSNVAHLVKKTNLLCLFVALAHLRTINNHQ